MKSISTLCHQLSLIVVLISAFSLSAWGEEVTITLNNGIHANSQITWTEDNFIVEQTKGNVNTAVNSSYISAPRVYKGHILSFTANSGYKITNISITYNSSYKGNSIVVGTSIQNNVVVANNNITSSISTNNNGTHTFTSKNGEECIHIQNLATQDNVQLRPTSVKVTIVKDNGSDPETPCITPEISFTETTVTKTNGDDPFTNTLTTNSSGAVTYTSSATNVATVDNDGQVTINGVGTTTITATVAADGTYCEATVEYTLTVEGRTFDITWMNGTDTHAETTYTEGGTLTLPTTDPTSCSDNYSTFVGWYTQQAGPTSNPSTELQGTEASKTNITDHTTFHAVFGDANGTSAPTESSIDFSAQGYGNGTTITSCKIGEATVTFDKGTNSNTPKYYTSGTAIRAYGGNNFTISSETTISSITITFGSDDGSNTITTDCGTYSDGKWTGSANSVKFTIGGTSGNRRIQGITIEFESSASSTYISTCDKEDIPAIYTTYDAIDFEPIVEKENSTKSTTITTVNLKESAKISISGTNASYFAVNPTSIEDNSETEITITFTAPDVDVETECTATLTITGGEQTKEIALTATVKPLFALTTNINGITQEVGSFAEGADITAALELKANDVTAPEGWSFAGWVANAIDGSQTTTPEYLTTMPAEATTAYAVFQLGKEQIFTETLSASTANYTGTNGYCEFTATSTSGTWKGTACYNTKGYLQINKNYKNYHIGSPIFTGNVTSLKITTTNDSPTDRTFYICSSNSTAQPTSGDLGQHTTTIDNEEFTIDLTKEAKQFYIYSSGAVYISKIEITYIEASDILYRTSVSSLVVENNATKTISENVNSLTLHVDKTPNTQLEVTETITADKVTVIQTIDASRWFFFSLPFDCNIADIVATGANGTLTYAPNETDGDYVIAKYNNGWVELIGKSHTLNANQGYIIGHFGSGDVTVKFPSADAQVISAPANATLEKTSDNGFNLIGLPYFQKVTNAGLNVAHVSIPNVSNPNEYGTYTQELYAEIIASIAPFTSFFVQTDAENIEFTLGAQQNAAPRLDGRSNRASLHKAVVTLTDTNGGADKTTIINNPSKTTDYEIGHDLTKLIGYAEIPQIYSLQGDEMLAFNSLAIDNSTVIPLGVYAHADGDYTFSLSEKSVGDLEGWELYDNETGKTTRLANEDLTVNLAQGTHEGRFEIRLQQRISTDCNNTMGDMTTWTANGTLNINNLPADAVVYIYDAVGRMVYVANNNSTTFNYTFAARGVYNIVIRTAENSVSFKTIY